MSDNSISRFEEMTKEQLLAELNVATEKNKYLRDRVDQFEHEEKKREFERRLAEATDFLNSNGYEVRQMTASERFPVEEGFQSLPGGVQVRKPERIWRDEDMKAFGLYWGQAPYDQNMHSVFESFVKSYRP